MRTVSPMLPGPLILAIDRLATLPVAATDLVARGAARDARLDASMLGDYLDLALRAARSNRSLARDELQAFRRLGQEAAAAGVDLPQLLDLYLSATWRLWRELVLKCEEASTPHDALAAAAGSLFRAADDTVQAIGAGFQEAQRLAIRREESLRREFVDDLLGGATDLRALEQRASAFGFNLIRDHRAVVGRADQLLDEASPQHRRIRASIFEMFGHLDVLVSTKDGLLVCILPGTVERSGPGLPAILQVLDQGGLRVGAGLLEPGLAGVGRSYQQAREALDIAVKLGLSSRVVLFETVLPYHVLLSEQEGLGDVVRVVLGGLQGARGGAGPLVETLEALFAECGNVTGAARRLYLSPRAVSYRLGTIERLTGRDPRDPEDRFVLEFAVKSARLLGDGGRVVSRFRLRAGQPTEVVRGHAVER